ncbi:MAG TPA: AAA family ATPase [Symbiobacteriaceae bacterium]|nr:AAA family ATPase [Symbiobacteriaceae bacterium]
MPQTKLPLVDSFAIEDYPLFKTNVRWDFATGVNLMLGVNGVGKTTTIRALAFALVGPLALNKHRRYFAARMDGKRDAKPTIAVAFRIADARFQVQRRLDTLEFVQFTLNEGETSVKRSGTTGEREYEQYLLRLTGIPSLTDFDFLLKQLLIREEEAENTLWNAEDHSRVLRLLFSDGTFEQEWAQAQSTVKDAHVRSSQVALALKTAKDSLAKLQRSKTSAANSTSAGEPEKLRIELEAVMERIAETQGQLDALSEPLGSARSRFDELCSRQAEIDERLAESEDKLLESESTFHTNLYKAYTPLRCA